MFVSLNTVFLYCNTKGRDCQRFIAKLDKLTRDVKTKHAEHGLRRHNNASDAPLARRGEGHGVRLKGPDSLIKSVKEYYALTAETLATPYIPVRRKDSKRKSAGI